jgi:NitT/TauT family transport system substrate-binding protein
VALKPEEMPGAIQARQVDAVSTWNYPLAEIRRLLGSDGAVFFDREIYTETFNIAARQEFIRNNPEIAKRFLRALLQAENFVTKNPGEAQTIMAAATKVDLGMVREVWSAFNYHVVLDHTLLITLEDETRWAMKNKLAEQAAMPNYLNYIHMDSLKAIKPEAIRLSR